MSSGSAGGARWPAGEEAVIASLAGMKTDPVSDLLIDGDKVMIRWKFTFYPRWGPADDRRKS